MNQNLKALIKILLVICSGLLLAVVNHSNNKLRLSNIQAKQQIVQLNANTKSVKAHHKNIIDELPNTYKTIRQMGYSIIQLQYKLIKLNPQVQTQQYNSIKNQLKGYIGSNTGWDAASSWIPNSQCKLRLVFGGMTSDASSYKVGFQILNKKNQLIGFIQSLYANNRFNNITSFYTDEGENEFNTNLKKYIGFADKQQQYAAYKNAEKLQKEKETKDAGSRGD